MTAENRKSLNRRLFLSGAAALTSAAAMPAFGQALDGSTEMLPAAGGQVRNNVSSFRMLEWQNYFDNTRNGALHVTNLRPPPLRELYHSLKAHFCCERGIAQRNRPLHEVGRSAAGTLSRAAPGRESMTNN